MTSDDEKDPPVPADLEGAAKRIHRVDGAEEHDHGHEARANEPWRAEVKIAGGKLTFTFSEKPAKGVVASVTAEPGAEYSAPEIRRLYAELGNVLAQLG